MKYSIDKLIDPVQMQKLLDAYCQSVGISAAIIDLQGEVFIKSKWQRICTDFHRINKTTCRACIESDTTLAEKIRNKESHAIYTCQNGLNDAVAPIKIEGEHVANVFVGQFLLQPPDRDRFRRQAKEFGFDEEEYLEALDEVPVIPRDKLPVILDFLTLLSRMISDTSLDRMKLKQAAAKLAEEAVRRKILVEESRDGIVVLDQSGKVYEANKRYIEMLGYTPEEIKHLHVWDWDTQWSRKKLLKMLREVDAEGDHFETRHRRKDGSLFDVEISTNGAVCGNRKLIFCVCRDITARKRAEQALRESQNRFQALFDNMEEGVALHRIIHDKAGGPLDFIVLDVNPAFECITGLKKEQVVGGKISVLYQNTEPPFMDIFARVATSGKAANFESYYSRIDKHLSVSVFRPEEGFLATVFSDITSHRKLEQEQVKAAKLESIGLLAGGIAHDFNNILMTLTGNISLARMNASALGHKEIIDIMSRSQAALKRASELTSQLLTFSRGGAPVKKTTSLPGLIREASGFALRGSNVSCRHYIAKDLRPAEVDEGQINQLVSNLVINADQAMPDGGSIVIRAKNVVVGEKDGLPLEDGQYVVISIRDQGHGITKEQLPKIFDPYFTTKEQGNGLGLTTSYSIAKRHGGHITVESVPGAGTTFHVYLPASSGKRSGKVSGLEGKILVMDDEKAVLDVVSRMLDLLGCDVERATTGTEAIASYKKAAGSGKPFDAVILDLTIPGGMGGRETIQRLRKLDPDVRAIVSSGYSNDPVVADYKAFGFSGVVSKPYEIEELADTLRKVMRNNGN